MSGVIILLHKKEEKELLRNWHPIMLLNTDYKLLPKLLVLRK